MIKGMIIFSTNDLCLQNTIACPRLPFCVVLLFFLLNTHPSVKNNLNQYDYDKNSKISFFAHSSLIYNIPEKFTGTKIHIFRGFITINIWHLLSFWKSFGIPRKTFNYHHSSTFYVVFNARSCFCLRIKTSSDWGMSWWVGLNRKKNGQF